MLLARVLGIKVDFSRHLLRSLSGSLPPIARTSYARSILYRICFRVVLVDLKACTVACPPLFSSYIGIFTPRSLHRRIHTPIDLELPLEMAALQTPSHPAPSSTLGHQSALPPSAPDSAYLDSLSTTPSPVPLSSTIPTLNSSASDPQNTRLADEWIMINLGFEKDLQTTDPVRVERINAVIACYAAELEDQKRLKLAYGHSGYKGQMKERERADRLEQTYKASLQAKDKEIADKDKEIEELKALLKKNTEARNIQQPQTSDCSDAWPPIVKSTPSPMPTTFTSSLNQPVHPAMPASPSIPPPRTTSNHTTSPLTEGSAIIAQGAAEEMLLQGKKIGQGGSTQSSTE